MIVAAHQPAYLPWLGYLDKMAKADLFVIMDDLPFEPRNFHHRNRIKHESGAAWLTVPVLPGATEQQRLADVLVDNGAPLDHHWQVRTWRTLVASYRRAPYFPRYVDDLRFVYTQPWRKLVDLQMYLIDLGRRWLRIRTPVIRASTLELAGDDLTDRLIDLCRKTGARAYLSGSGNATRTLDAERMGRAGLGVIWQCFDHPQYTQPYGDFVPQLAFLDLLFNCGDASRDILFGDGHPYHVAA
jgi:hypothetical protein